jgi:SPP1 gp7 family putative phage head morphogenesis protein
MRWGGFFRDLFGGASRQVSVHGEMLPSGDMAYAGQQVSPSPIDISEYRLMRRHPTVASSLEVRLTGMLPGLQVVAADEHDPRAMKAKEVIERCLSLMHGSPLVTLKTLADEGLTYGATVAEPVWMLAPGGYWTLRALKPKRMESLRVGLVCDEYGNLEGVRQAAPGAPDFVPADQIIYWRHRGGWYEPYGVSALYEAYDAWKAQTIFVRAWAIYLSRHGQGILTWKVPAAKYQAEVSRLTELLTNLQTGTGIPLRDTDSLELIESSGAPTQAYQAYYQTLDKAIVRAILYQELATGEGVRVGSFAASQTQADIMWSVLRVQGEGFCEEIREQLFPQLLARNGYGDLPVPLLLPEPIGAPPDPAALVQTLATGVQSGVLPPLTPEQAQDILARLGVSAAIQESDRTGAALSAGCGCEHGPAKLAAGKRDPLEAEFDRADDAAAREMSDIWQRTVPGIMDRIGAALWDTKTEAWKTRSAGAIRDAVTSAVKYKGQELRDALTGHLEKRYRSGAEYGRKVAAKHGRKKLAVAVGTVEITPTQALDALKQGSFLALQKRYDALAEDLYYSIYRTMRGDQTIRAAAAAVQATLETRGFSYDQALTLVRTEMTRAYNEGRIGIWTDDETRDRYTQEAGKIIGYRFNAVMDAATTDECSSRNGLVFDPDEVDIPPLHYNCRSVLEPIYSDDGEDVANLPWTLRSEVPEPGFDDRGRKE